MDALKKACIAFEKEAVKRVNIFYGSAAIALWEFWGWREKKIKHLLELTQDIWNECSSDNNISMLQMLENETGIDMRIPETGKSWHDVAFLNAKINMKIEDMSRPQIIYMRQQQTKWVGAQVLAGICIALHRKHQFGATRISRLISQINEVRFQYEEKEKVIINECMRITGIDINGWSY